MTRSKLSASDREELIRLFKETTETITSLANRFQVSISTARRVLKTELTDDEYEAVVANRMEGRQNKRAVKSSAEEPLMLEVQSEIGDDNTAMEPSPKLASPVKPTPRRSRRRSSAEDTSVSVPAEDTLSSVSIDTPDTAPVEEAYEPVLSDPAELDGITPLEVLPIDTVTLPNQCYLVVDRASELITPPLKEFAELGSIPPAEESAKTLPIFPNHKIASRFSRRSQRIIKIPNSAILKKTYPMLTAKGVERILFDGQVFSLVHEA